MTCSGESDEGQDARLTHIWLHHGVTRMVTILNGKPVTRHYGFRFLAGPNMATHTRTCAEHY